MKAELKKPTWLKYTKEEVKAIILKLSNKGLTSEKIGLTLRDQYGIPTARLNGIKIKEILGEDFQEPAHRTGKHVTRSSRAGPRVRHRYAYAHG